MTRILPFFLIIFITINAEANSLKVTCKPPAIFIYGDSYVDAGNNNYINTSTLDQANFPPYGETYFKNSTGRFSDGRIIPDFLAQLAGLKDLVPVYLDKTRTIDQNYNGANFASAVAGALPTTLPGFAISLQAQLQNYKTEVGELNKRLGPNEARKISSTAVHYIAFGATDYIIPIELNSTIFDHRQYVNMVIGNLSTIVEAIYNQGGRKFVLQNVLDLGCSPGLKIYNVERDVECLKNASDLVYLHNEALDKLVSEKARLLSGSEIFLFDLRTTVSERTANPGNYGFKDGGSACCGSGRFNGEFSCGGKRPIKEFSLCPKPSEYVFWDSFHLTEHAYGQITSQIWNKPDGRLKGLFACL
ncbi:GDSL esterase/lipase 5 [Striga hermonthica]|uniref:GDSL esterase/lipase 5 n=1 Tax=Striga hermonthica TaxID=68872 RepID=A0A9N7N9F7_STRHE|nr:GDSL esterase/lipase 5 [Striga hermonthica]